MPAIIDLSESPYNVTSGPDMTSAIQGAIDDGFNSGFGGHRLLLPPGIFMIPGGLTMRGGVALEGVSRTSTILRVGESPHVAVRFDETCNRAMLQHLTAEGDATPGTFFNNIEIANNVPALLNDLNVFGGYNALFTGGVDGEVFNCFISTGRNANVVSVGSQRYTDCKFDVAGPVAPSYSFYQAQSFGGPIATVNELVNCDLTGAWQVAALVLNDGCSQSALNMTGGELGGEAKVDSGKWLGLTGVKLGPDIYCNDPNGTVTATGCLGFTRTCSIHGGPNNVFVTGSPNVFHV